ncbi:NUDIX hydrolase [Kushneria marisflavi]|uniref:NUDIX hydrolase n=1 Tax=Kushneria marisflavi TaxID=157779 RepID=A0A240UMT9_9GAMM|nr:NUDIX domain-containing protein [Kushneria marisflavi]ART62446.1 NUDIX hydrolase [Kushneria marisflavi]RKD87566.1 isopentenyldiphosphate isomerase [Kushneria marisflavi]
MGSSRARVQIVDTLNRPAGSARRCDMRRLKIWHRAVYILVLDQHDRLCVQRRTLCKDIFPGYRDLCAGGVVDAGESMASAARRELHEELGLSLTLSWCLKLHFEEGMNAFGSVFIARYHNQPITLQSSEVEAIEWMTLSEALAVQDATPDSQQVLKALMDQGFLS